MAKLVRPVVLEYEGRKIGTATVAINEPLVMTEPVEIDLQDVEPIWLRTALTDSIIKQNAYARRRHRG
jgi:hypothetical protein